MEDNGSKYYLRYLEGDDEGIADIVRAYKDGLIFFINGYVKNIYVAEEITEDVFFRLMVKKPPFTPKYSFKTWLYSIGRNMAVDYIRKKSKSREISDTERITIEADEISLADRVIRNEDKIALYRALSKLPDRYEQVLKLTFLQGFTNEQAGKIMHKTKRQIEMLIYRAKQALKKQLENDGFSYESV
ncbi:MAG: RNA polymerase sigma factor [Bacteroides sp.]|nr:RNA polymerase sigma factor [Bacteroides sp.]